MFTIIVDIFWAYNDLRSVMVVSSTSTMVKLLWTGNFDSETSNKELSFCKAWDLKNVLIIRLKSNLS